MFTYLLEGLGAKNVQFEELLTLEEAELQQLRYGNSLELRSLEYEDEATY